MSRFALTAIFLEFKLILPPASVWDLTTGKCKSTLQGHTDQVLRVAISSDGKSIVSGSDNTVR